ncbi:MAG: TetR/AcrR family transcriptional regulator [Micavibrio aeruginosavorus]|nr:TetR/AcrR family transcriptional regulator [Micavibrio aeruginosavorus]
MAKAKSPKKPALPLRERAVRAALDLAARQPWGAVTMRDIAGAAKCTLAELYNVFGDRHDILAAYGRQIDCRVMEESAADPDAPERDRLFDVMMARFDVLNEDRAAVVSILKSFCTAPKNALISLPHLGRSMVRMLEAAAIDPNGPRGAVTALGLAGVYLCTLRAWMGDESDDMGKTMAALDRGLERAEKAAEFLNSPKKFA